ncbi:MAG TPA: hypothetical protein VF445_13935 [Bordetella sp.]|uniref:hypothetical protein n=1 Tax=Bordetella sp. TaxID=28081 RepID=UPI002ED513E8
MDVQQLVAEFLASDHGSQAAQALADQGVNPDDAQQMLSQAAQAAHGHLEEQSSGLLGNRADGSFLAALASGLVHGEGLVQSLEDGGAGVLNDRVAESLAEKMDVSPDTAATIAATVTPYLTSFLKEKLT